MHDMSLVNSFQKQLVSVRIPWELNRRLDEHLGRVYTKESIIMAINTTKELLNRIAPLVELLVKLAIINLDVAVNFL